MELKSKEAMPLSILMKDEYVKGYNFLSLRLKSSTFTTHSILRVVNQHEGGWLNYIQTTLTFLKKESDPTGSNLKQSS